MASKEITETKTGDVNPTINGNQMCMSFFVPEDDWTLQLWNAIHKGDVTQVKVLLKMGVDVNIADRNGNTALHMAADNKKDDIVKKLIKAGADLDAQNENGHTALHLAASKGYTYIVMNLLDAGCDVDLKTQFTGMTALHMASKHGHTEVVQLIMDYGADINAVDVIEHRPSDYSGSTEITEMFEEYKHRLHRRRPSQQHRNSIDLKANSNSSNNDSVSLHGLSTNENEGYRLDKAIAKSLTEGTKHNKGKKFEKTVKFTTIPVDQSLDYSEKHKKRMKMSVFDRLSKK